MTPVVALLDRARILGVVVEPNGPKLRVVAPPGLADRDWSALVDGLARYKAEVLAMLSAPPPTILRFPSAGPVKVVAGPATAPPLDPLRPPGLGWMPPASRLVGDARRLGVLLAADGPKLRATRPPGVSDYDWDALTMGLGEFESEVLGLLG